MARPKKEDSNSGPEAENKAMIKQYCARTEAIRKHRKQDVEHLGGYNKLFTQEELDFHLTERGLGSYKRLLNNRQVNLPSRAHVNATADFLECSNTERNALLRTLRYEPEEPDLSEEQEALLQQEALVTLKYCGSLPAFVVSRQWNIQAFNASAVRLFGISSRIVQAPVRPNVLNLIFDPDLEVRQRLGDDGPQWEELASRNLYMFKEANVLSRFERWYQNRIEELRRIKDFQRISEKIESPTFRPQITFRLDILCEEIPIHVRLRQIHLPIFDYPQVWYYLPCDDFLSQRTFREMDFINT